jgi:hypothetical protein
MITDYAVTTFRVRTPGEQPPNGRYDGTGTIEFANCVADPMTVAPIRRCDRLSRIASRDTCTASQVPSHSASPVFSEIRENNTGDTEIRTPRIQQRMRSEFGPAHLSESASNPGRTSNRRRPLVPGLDRITSMAVPAALWAAEEVAFGMPRSARPASATRTLTKTGEVAAAEDGVVAADESGASRSRRAISRRQA